MSSLSDEIWYNQHNDGQIYAKKVKQFIKDLKHDLLDYFQDSVNPKEIYYIIDKLAGPKLTGEIS